MKRFFALVLILIIFGRCANEESDPNNLLEGNRELFLMYGLPAFRRLQIIQDYDYCNNFHLLKEFTVGQTYNFYSKSGFIGKIPFKGKGIQITLELLTPNRRGPLWVFICEPYDATLFITNATLVKEYSGGVVSKGVRYAELGLPLTLKVWDLTYQYYLIESDMDDTSSLDPLAEALTDFKITIEEL